MTDLFAHWLEKKAQLDKAKAELLNAEKLIWKDNADYLDNRGLGTSRIIKGNKVLIVVKKETLSVDSKKVLKLGLENSKALTQKFSLNAKVFNNLTEMDKTLYNDVITSKPAKPSFKIEEVEEG